MSFCSVAGKMFDVVCPYFTVWALTVIAGGVTGSCGGFNDGWCVLFSAMGMSGV